MDTNALEDKFLKVLAENDQALLQALTNRLLETNRATALVFFESFVARIVSRSRQKFLEALMEDGGKDLIPIFIKALREEKNVLYAKSLIFLYGYFEHAEALVELQKIEETIHFDLVKPYQKVLGNMKSKFRELFYIDEFKYGSRNPKRMNHAARKMIETPNPVYIPFLNQAIHDPDAYLQRTAVKTLAELGDVSSLEAVLGMLPDIFRFHQRADYLRQFLTSPKTWQVKKLAWFVANLAKIGGWDEAVRTGLENRIKAGKAKEVIADINRDILPFDTGARDDINSFLEMALSGGSPKEAQVQKLERLFEDFLADIVTRMQNIFMTLGRLGERLEVKDLHQRVKDEIPDDVDEAESLMITFMGGFRSDESLDQLVASLTPDLEHHLAEKVLNSLEEYSLRSIPDRLREIALDVNSGTLRKHVLRIVAESNLLDELLDDLLGHASVAVRTDAFDIIADYQNEKGGKRLLEMLDPELSPRILEMLIKALESFPSDAVGEAVASFLQHPYPSLVRVAALETIYLAGGEKRMHLLVEGISKYPENKRSEIIDRLFQIPDVERNLNLLFEHPHFWGILLNEAHNTKQRIKAIDLLGGADWNECAHQDWLTVFHDALENDKVARDSKEGRTLRVLMLKARNALQQMEAHKEDAPKAAPKPAPSASTTPLGRILDKIEAASLHEQDKAFRVLNLHLKPDWVKAGDPETERLVRVVGDLLRQQTGNEDLIRIGISLAAKIQDQRLMDAIKTLLSQGSHDLVEYVRHVFTQQKRSEQTKPIQKILVLDDTSLITKTLTRQLQRAGFETTGHMRQEEALADLRAGSFDLLILDYLMPGSTGLSFLQNIRREGVAPEHILWITSSRDESDLALMQSVPNAGILHKPFPINHLMTRIDEMKVA